MSHVQFKCRTVPSVTVGLKMADIGNKHTHACMGIGPVNLHFDLRLTATVAKMFSRVSFSTT